MDSITLWTCLSWLALHRFILNRGFVLRRRGLSTDTRISSYLAATSIIWFFSTVWKAYDASADLSGQQALLTFLTTMATGPILPFLVSCLWIVMWIDGYLAEKYQRRPELFSLVNVLGPFDWRSGMPPVLLQILNILATSSVAACGLAAIASGDSLLGVLSFIGLGLFLSDGISHNPYVHALHQYADDRLRVILATSHHEGTVYVLPSQGVGFNATWSPKIKDEHRAADHEIMNMFSHFRSGRVSLSEPLERIRSTLVAYEQRIRVSTAQLEHLAAWIYVVPELRFSDSRKMLSARADGVNLLGRELLYALCHAEYMIFMAQGRLPPQVTSLLHRLRSMQRSGAGQGRQPATDAIGFKPGMEGFNEAVRHIYAIFDEDVDVSTHDFAGTAPPAYSVALKKSPESIEAYVSELWDVSCVHSESTFTAMYFFSLVWSMELGNVNGWHLFPARCQTRDGDLVGQELVWRQLWYLTLLVQLIMKSPLLLGIFALGIVQ